MGGTAGTAEATKRPPCAKIQWPLFAIPPNCINFVSMNTSATQAVRISVVMCTCNGERFLKEQLDSIMAQELAPHELIIQDDASTDSTPDLLRAYAETHPNTVRLFFNEERLGFNRNFHTAMLRATGTHVAIADQDDIWYPQKLRRQADAIGGADVCFSAYDRDPAYSAHPVRHVCPSGDLAGLVFSNVIPGHTLLVRRDFLDRAEAWNEGFYYDWWFLLVAAIDGHGVVRVDEPLNWHRPHAASAIARLRQRNAWRDTAAHPTWQPYVYGWADLYRLRRQPMWRQFYSRLRTLAADGRAPLVHDLASALLDGGLPWRLCRLCLRNRATLSPTASGARQCLRAFCYPAIYAYGNTNFNL